MDWPGGLAPLARSVGPGWPRPIVGSILGKNWWPSVSLNIFLVMSTAYFTALRTSSTSRWLNGGGEEEIAVNSGVRQLYPDRRVLMRRAGGLSPGLLICLASFISKPLRGQASGHLGRDKP